MLLIVIVRGVVVRRLSAAAGTAAAEPESIAIHLTARKVSLEGLAKLVRHGVVQNGVDGAARRTLTVVPLQFQF